MDLNQLQIFAAIAEHQSFTKAASQLQMDKSTVSTKLSKLESKLGVRLLNRSTRAVTLTEAGAGYFGYCKQILEIAKEAEEYAVNLGDEAVGLLRISAAHAFSRFFITQLIQPFMEQNPQLEVELIFGNDNVDLVGQQIDLALRLDIRSIGLKDSSLVARKFISTEAGLFCSPAYMNKLVSIAPNVQLHEVDFIEFTIGHSFEALRQLVNNTHPNYAIKSSFKVNDINSGKEAAMAGLGVVMLPKLAVKDELSKQQLVPLAVDGALPMVDIYAVYPSREYMPAKLQRFLQFLMPSS
jgi:DNA-binding transcriptional LysR family regulator